MREQQEYLLDCEVLSAMRNPLAGRSSASVEELALKSVRERNATRILQLLARREPRSPLEGYEIFAKKPLPKESDEQNTGRCDWD